MKKAVCIDGTHLAMVSWFRAKTVSQNPTATAVKIYRQMVEKLMREQGDFSTFCVAWEGMHGSAWRKKVCTSYKASRTYDPNAMIALSNCREETNCMNLISLEIPHAEADDTLYAACMLLTKKGYTCTVVSSDRDMLQIVQDGWAIQQWDPVQKKAVPVPDYSIVGYKSLVGDTSDNLPGVKGVGPAKAKRILEGAVSLTLEQQALFEEQKALISFMLHPERDAILSAVDTILTDSDTYQPAERSF